MRRHNAKTLESLQTLRSAYWAAVMAVLWAFRSCRHWWIRRQGRPGSWACRRKRYISNGDSGHSCDALVRNLASLTPCPEIWEKLNLKITVCSGRTFKVEWCILAAAEEHPRASPGSTREADTSMVQRGPGYTLSWHQNLTMPYHPPHGTGVQSLETPRLRVLWKAAEPKGALWEARR